MWFPLLALGALAGSTAADHPAVKIIAMLDKLQAQVKHEGEVEVATYAKFQTWCADLTKQKTKEIAASDAKIASCQASIESLTEDIALLETQIEDTATAITTAETDRAEAETDRGNGNAAYLLAKSDLDDTNTAIADSITSLEANAPSLAVVRSALSLVDMYAPTAKAAKAHAFLEKQAPVDSDESAASIARGRGEAGGDAVREYDFKSGGVIEILKQLKLKFEDELEAANKAEAAAASAHTLMDATMDDQIIAMQTAKTTKETIESRKGVELAAQNADFASETALRGAADGVLTTTKTECSTAVDEFKERSARREGEVAAMHKAIEILEKVTGVRMPSDKLDSTEFSFVQVESPVAKIVTLLRKSGSTHHAAALTRLADQIAALESAKGSTVFSEVKTMIEKMVMHLMSEQRDEDTHKNWCDTEFKKSNQMKDDHEDKRDELSADITLLNSQITGLTDTVTSNMQLLGASATAVEDATLAREQEAAENKATIKDAQEAQTAVANAIAVLSDFYKGTGEMEKDTWDATQLVQTSAAVRRVSADPEKPEGMWDVGTDYTGTSGGSSVVALLTDVATDFASMEAQAKSDEVSQSDTFDSWLTDEKADQSDLKKDNEVKNTQIENLKTKLGNKNTDATNTAAALKATEVYLVNLEPACTDGDSTYDDRKAARTQETEALNTAKGILADAFKEAEA